MSALRTRTGTGHDASVQLSELCAINVLISLTTSTIHIITDVMPGALIAHAVCACACAGQIVAATTPPRCPEADVLMYPVMLPGCPRSPLPRFLASSTTLRLGPPTAILVRRMYTIHARSRHPICYSGDDIASDRVRGPPRKPPLCHARHRSWLSILLPFPAGS
ncbi:hypothetical protein C8Q80DRAFT_871183 [Daedaleopsis nitida]|nr:hypothetical protein C8Q80DRAFT_871183 [Daedaleopsis nitida]